MTSSEELLYFNGIDARTGGYLRRPTAARDLLRPWRAAAGASGGHDPGLLFAGESLEFLGQAPLAPVKGPGDLRYWTRDADPERLESSGWGVIFAHGADPAVREALRPLLEHRRGQAARHHEDFYRELERRPGESLRRFLERHGVGPGPVDPEKLPYYLLVVGDPEEIPYDFQFELDVQYGVGRLAFDTPEEYHRYATAVVLSETRPEPSEGEGSRLTFFGVEHPGDPATREAREALVRRLAERIGRRRPGCGVDVVEGDAATKERLALLLGAAPGPGVLFTSTHGLGFPGGDPLQRAAQGALVTGDWPGPAAGGAARLPGPEHYFAAADVSASARLDGKIFFLYGCHTAGTPRLESFSRRYFREPIEQAPTSFVSRLAQTLLAHEGGGALAVIGHVDQTWSSSFRWRRAGAQTQAFESALKEILDGRPVGMAMESFGLRYAELSSMLVATAESQVDDLALANLWTAHHDARNFVILGDPAVRIPPPAAPAEAAASGGATAHVARPPKPAPARRGRGAAEKPEDLEIRIFPDGGDGFRCSLKVGARSRSAPFQLPMDRGDVARLYEDYVERLAARPALLPHSRLVMDVGETLFAALFPEPLRILYERTREQLRGRPLRLLFHVDPECASRAVLSSLPWEWLYWRERQDFPSLNRRSPVVRFVEVDCPPPPKSAARLLRVLVVTSGTRAMPSALEESRKIAAALSQHSRIEVETLDNVTLGALRERLNAASFHAVHFIGHGLYAQDEGISRIVVCDQQGRPLPVSGEELAQTLRDFTTLRFVFFNSCDTARTDAGTLQPFAGVANALLRDGVPAVVAMQFPIRHDAAVDFSAGFYAALAKGDPLDAAVAEGRQAIRAARPDSIEWGTPVLFVRTNDLGVLGAPKDSGRRLRRLAAGATLLFAVLWLAATVWPAAKWFPIDLELATSYVGFRLAEATAVLHRLAVSELRARDLGRIELPASADVGTIVKDDSFRRLDLDLEADLTLQHRQGTLVPAEARIEMRHASAGGTSYRLSIEPAESLLYVSIRGPYRFRVRGFARLPHSWREIEASIPESLELHPRSGRLDLDLDLAGFTDDDLSSSIPIEGLWLHETEELADGDTTRLVDVFHVIGGRGKVAGESIELSPGAELRLEDATGDVSGLRWGENGIRLRFVGETTQRPAWGALPPESERRGFTALAGALTALSGVGTLFLYIPLWSRRLRVRSATRHTTTHARR